VILPKAAGWFFNLTKFAYSPAKTQRLTASTTHFLHELADIGRRIDGEREQNKAIQCPSRVIEKILLETG
jgi:hypothetical protein